MSFQLAVCCSWNHQIFINKENGTDNPSCLKGIIPCATFNMALKGLTNDSTVINIGPGTYTLEQGNETSIGPGLQQIAIIGNGDNTIILCTPLNGLEFFSTLNILIESITLKGCGRPYQLTIDFAFSERLLQSEKQFQAALYINSCYGNISLSNVTIQNSNGTGFYLHQLYLGNLLIEDSFIEGGIGTKQNQAIQNGIVLSQDMFSTNKGIYHIRNTDILNNHYYDSDEEYCVTINGGGIAIIYPANYHMIIESCVISNNSKGITLYGKYSNNDIVISDTNIVDNHKDSLITLPDIGTDFTLNLYDVIMLDQLVITYHGHNKSLYTKRTPDGYTINNDMVTIDAHFDNKYEQIYSIKIEGMNFDKCYSQNKHVTGLCPIDGITTVKTTTSYCPPSYSICDDDNCSCSNNHGGPLCGQCIDGYSVAFNSPYLSCVDCNGIITVVKGWAILMALEFIPITVMIIIIAILGVNLNQGSLNAYILFCQIITITFPSVGYPAWFTSVHYLVSRFLDFTLLPFTIWNLEFIDFPSCNVFDNGLTTTCDSHFSICLSSSLSPLGAISFWYVIALYPLLLLILLYSCIIMYDKGWRCIVCIVRPVHRLLARFWRSFNIQPSLAHTITSVYTLCFTQLATTSLKLLQPSWYRGSSHTNIVFFYDGSQSYFRGWHGLAGTIAILILLALIVITSYLLVYRFQAFQWCLGKMKVKKSFLISVTDVFTRPYKDGADNSFDYRNFAGVHFVLRFIFIMTFYIPYAFTAVTAVINVSICILYACILVIFRPYKRNMHNFTEMLLFLVLMVLSLSQFYHKANQIEYGNLVFLGIIFLMVNSYCFFWMIKKCCQCSKQKNTYVSLNSTHFGDQNDDEILVEDRKQYHERHVAFTRPLSIQMFNEIHDNDRISYSTFK